MCVYVCVCVCVCACVMLVCDACVCGVTLAVAQDVANNMIERLPPPDAMRLLPHLALVYLHHNNLQSWDAVEALAALPSVALVTLHSNPIAEHPTYRHYVVNKVRGDGLLAVVCGGVLVRCVGVSVWCTAPWWCPHLLCCVCCTPLPDSATQSARHAPGV